jgi:hypothetical protein
MITFHKAADDEPALHKSQMVEAFKKTCWYIEQHGSIPLTSTNRFDPAFMAWALTKVNWVEYISATALLKKSRPVQEHHFIELYAWHRMLIASGIAKHANKRLTLTSRGRRLMDHPGEIPPVMVPYYLSELPWVGSRRSRVPFDFRNWDRFIPLLDGIPSSGTTVAAICETLLAEADLGTPDLWFELDFYSRVMMPLFWTGLFDAILPDRNDASGKVLYAKTPLWNAVIRVTPEAEDRGGHRVLA